ncbi:NAD-dependent epimerase/dehydratase family protein [Mesorhizobium sp. NBSH29]|uniref:NAD-dependent epimerase/dehydratase family protein n=1 Tax=Mesorhizobium sp. NBSH29 TaxID=2654249 RepID=UPI0018967862|nr:NAD-dependent epimerase/dehydratase family protein [Mesorhizobium sp. NBSH29]QPC87925.1 NAD-dependent epimerase/dehydratase family protein [Mesorhizobium sp. NBSH29]
MKILLTGAAGFIGYHTTERLLARGDTVLGIDNLNAYYATSLKQARLALLERHPAFAFLELDVAQRDLAAILGDRVSDVDLIVHLAAQAGVRYSVENPFAYVDSNVTGQVALLELAAHLPKRPALVYASSSSVYGAAEAVPFTETARADSPVSVYAATKRAGELLAHAYGELYGLKTTGLRFFTVYGRYGRPDMAPWLFTDAILKGNSIDVFNHGVMQRDFTHISDIVDGVVAAADRIVSNPDGTAPLYNLGNNKPVALLDFIAAIEHAAGRKAKMVMKPKPAGDVLQTYADIALAERDLGFRPKTHLADGIADFVQWFKTWPSLNQTNEASMHKAPNK